MSLFILPSLPYAYDGLEPYIDARTMEIHYTKHHQGYVDKLNKAVEKYQELQKKPVEDLLKDLNTVPADVRMAVKNFGGGVYNHTLFWNCMKHDGGGEPKEKFAEQIKKDFGSFEEFKKEFSDGAKKFFGSGWAWLVVDGKKLFVMTSQNQECPLSDGFTPLLTLDIWEHAYYLKYQNRRPEFVDNWWSLIDWDKVERRFEEG